MAAADIAQIAKRIEAAAKRALPLAATNVAFALESMVQECFDVATDPYGAAWLPKATGTGKPLHDQGKLAASFHVTKSTGEVTVGSSDTKALWHQEGTATYRGGQPYDIYPKKKKALAIPVANQRGWAHPKAGEYLQADPSRRLVKAGSTKAKGAGRRIHGSKVTASILAKHVRHPGVPRRMMLPDKDNVPSAWRETIRRSIDTAIAHAFRGLSG